LSALRQFSFFLLTVETVVLVFPTCLGVVVLLAAGGLVWNALWASSEIFGALVWLALVFSLVAAWWLLLAYFYKGPQGARRVPIAVWAYAALIAILASVEVAFGGENSPLQGLGVGFLFVPTFLHLVGEVWVWGPNSSTRGNSQG